MGRVVTVLVLLLLPAAAWGEEKGVDVRDLMTQREFTEAGLGKLSEEEIGALNRWLAEFKRTGASQTELPPPPLVEEKKEEKKEFLGGLFGGAKYKIYKIEGVQSGYTFHINRRRFDSTSICPGYKVGDEVIFTEGRADGACTSAVFMRPGGGDVCQVFCK